MGSERRFISGGTTQIVTILEWSQAVPTCPSDKGSSEVLEPCSNSCATGFVIDEEIYNLVPFGIGREGVLTL